MTILCRALIGSLALGAAVAPALAVAAGRERAAEQIPELMGRILESQEEIREREGEYAPVVQRYTEKLVAAREAIGKAEGDEAAAEALVDYVETYAARPRPGFSWGRDSPRPRRPPPTPAASGAWSTSTGSPRRCAAGSTARPSASSTRPSSSCSSGRRT